MSSTSTEMSSVSFQGSLRSILAKARFSPSYTRYILSKFAYRVFYHFFLDVALHERQSAHLLVELVVELITLSIGHDRIEFITQNSWQLGKIRQNRLKEGCVKTVIFMIWRMCYYWEIW